MTAGVRSAVEDWGRYDRGGGLRSIRYSTHTHTVLRFRTVFQVYMYQLTRYPCVWRKDEKKLRTQGLLARAERSHGALWQGARK